MTRVGAFSVGPHSGRAHGRRGVHRAGWLNGGMRLASAAAPGTRTEPRRLLLRSRPVARRWKTADERRQSIAKVLANLDTT